MDDIQNNHTAMLAAHEQSIIFLRKENDECKEHRELLEKRIGSLEKCNDEKRITAETIEKYKAGVKVKTAANFAKLAVVGSVLYTVLPWIMENLTALKTFLLQIKWHE